MAVKQRIQVKIPHLYLSKYDFEGNLKDIIETLNNIDNNITELNGGVKIEYDNLHLEYSHYDSSDMDVTAWRDETDAEEKERLRIHRAEIKKANEIKKAKEALESTKEYETYLKLQKKYGN